jgi:hypothetical protein
MLDESFFRNKADYLAYKNDVFAWGEEDASRMWLQDYEAFSECGRKAIQQGEIMRRWEDLSLRDREELLVQEVRGLINIIISDNDADREYFSNWVLALFNRFANEKDEQDRETLRNTLIAELKDEALWQLRTRSYPERMYPAQPTTKPPESQAAASDQEGDRWKQWCDQCHDFVIGTPETLKYHKEVTCQSLPKNRVDGLAEKLATPKEA